MKTLTQPLSEGSVFKTISSKDHTLGLQGLNQAIQHIVESFYQSLEGMVTTTTFVEIFEHLAKHGKPIHLSDRSFLKGPIQAPSVWFDSPRGMPLLAAEGLHDQPGVPIKTIAIGVSQ